MSDFENNGYDYNEPTAADTLETAQETFDSAYSAYDAAPENNGKAFGIVSLVCGIVSLPLICCTYIGLIVAVTSIVFGILSIKKGENAKGMAIAGIICSAVAIVVIIFLLIFAASLGSADYDDVMKKIEDMIQNS